MNNDAILQSFRDAFPDLDLEITSLPVDEHVIALPADRVHAAVAILVEQFGIYHLSTITGQDRDENLELFYHFWQGHGLTLRTSLPYDAPVIPTVTDLIPGATFYEREVCEMLDVTFEGHANLEPLFLPDNWEGGAPLRKDFVVPPVEGGLDVDKEAAA